MVARGTGAMAAMAERDTLGVGRMTTMATTGVATLKARVRTGSAQSLLERAAPHDITLRGPSLWSLLTH